MAHLLPDFLCANWQRRARDAYQAWTGWVGVPVCCPRAQLMHKVPDGHTLWNAARHNPAPSSAENNIIRCLCKFQARQRGGPIENILHLQQNRGSRVRNHESIYLHSCWMGPCAGIKTRRISQEGIRRVLAIRDSHALRMSGI